MSISVVRLPSMDLIKGFVAVGRRMSITKASDDLCVTQSAVSRQIHTLEDTLGVKLLVRRHRSIGFTPEGERLFWVADTAVRQLQEVVASISASRDRRPVTVSAAIGVAGLWLVPRMGAFQQVRPDIDLRIVATGQVVDLRSEGVDLAIRYCTASTAPKGAVRLFGEHVAPVASPTLMNTALDGPESVCQYFLLEFDNTRRHHLQWADWLESRGWGTAKPKGILRFNHYDQVIQAALAGQGIALGRLELLGNYLEERKLVALGLPEKVNGNEYAHWMIQGDPEPRKDVLDVMAWVRAQATEMGIESRSERTSLTKVDATKSHEPRSFQRGKKVA